VKSWLETCKVLDSSVSGLVDDAIHRGASLVLEGVSIVPSRRYIDRFIANAPGGDGMACGVLLVVSDEERHRQLLRNRGVATGNNEAEERKVRSFHRIRAIQDEMIRRANDSGWTLIEQRVDLDPLDVVSEALYKGSTSGDGGNTTRTSTIEAVDEDEYRSKS
jgi:2-phosphoglycerate kinase